VANAVHAAARCTVRLAALPLADAPRVTLSVTRTGGGLSVNAIPAAAWLEVDLRSTDGALLDRYTEVIRRAAEGAAREENAERAPGSPALAAAVRVIGDRPAGALDAAAPLVALARAATELVGRRPSSVRRAPTRTCRSASACRPSHSAPAASAATRTRPASGSRTPTARWGSGAR
jgi:metal-dependent amidase/aminoacylase/carboxypeptidase family protein